MTNTAELEIAGRTLKYSVSYKRIRHGYLRIRPDFLIDITLPKNGSITAESMLESKRRWIARKIAELEQVKKIFVDHRMLYLGEYVPIVLSLPLGKPETVQLCNGTLSIFGGSERKNRKMLDEFLSCQTLWYARNRAEEFKIELGVSYRDMTVKKMKKWGYCTRDGKIVFNSRLICLPQRLIDYIVFHELLHLKHFNHLKRFKAAMSKQFAGRRELDRELRLYVA